MPGRTNKRKPPRGLVVNHDDLAALAGQPNQANNSLQAIDTEIVSLKRQVCPLIEIIQLQYISCGYIFFLYVFLLWRNQYLKLILSN